jgi:predicted pyridoxine 5'-phosphate oxidase superfamily flavin-nucleotide-binding protein
MIEIIKNFIVYWIAFLYSRFLCTQKGRYISIPIVIDGQLLSIPLFEKNREYYPITFYNVDEPEIDKQIRILLKYTLRINKEVDVITCDSMEKTKIYL